MLNPYIRVNLVDGRADLRLPDVYGVYTFRVNYKRIGYTSIDEQDVIAIRPVRHDGYPRFLSAAWPYYTTLFSMMLATCGLLLYLVLEKDTKVQSR